jgi:hypothetical protein
MKKSEWPISAKKAKKEGKPVSKKELKTYTKNFQKAIKNDELSKNFKTGYGKREGEFFGCDRIEELLKAANKAASVEGNECVGIRFYYGLAYEEINAKKGTTKISTKPIKDKNMSPRLFMVGVDQNGADIEMDKSQLKDAGGNGVGDGFPKPPFS